MKILTQEQIDLLMKYPLDKEFLNKAINYFDDWLSILKDKGFDVEDEMSVDVILEDTFNVYVGGFMSGVGMICSEQTIH